MSTHLHPTEFCLSEDEAASRLIEIYSPSIAANIIQATPVSWYVDRSKWDELARAAHYGLDVYDFVIDDKSSLAFVGVAAHVDLIPTLYWATARIRFGDFTQMKDRYEIMDQWVLESQGCFKSKAGSGILMSASYVLPPELSLLAYRSVVIE